MRFKERRLPVVDARRVDADRAHRPVGDDPLRGIGMQAGEVQLRDGLLSAFRCPEIALRVGPAPREAGSEEQDRILADLPVLALEALQIVDRDLIVSVSLRRVGHVDDQRWTNQPLEWNLIDRLMSLREVHRRVDVSAAVFGGEEAVRRVVVALVGDPVRVLAQPEPLGGRPEDRLRVVAVREIDELAGGKCSRCFGRSSAGGEEGAAREE
jgi:hypothetical protein